MKLAFASLTGSAFASWLDQRLVHDEIGVCFATVDRRLDRSFSGSLSLLVH